MPIISGGSGGIAPASLGREQFFGGGTTNIGAGGTAALTWAHGQNDVLVDLTSPTAPALLVAGVYVLSVIAQGAGLAAGEGFQLQTDMDLNGDDAEAIATLLNMPASGNPRLCVTQSWYCGAGAVLQAQVDNFSASTVSYQILEANLQRVA